VSIFFFEFQKIPIITARGSPFKDRLQKFLLWCVQSGLMTKWFGLVRSTRKDDREVRPLTVGHLLPALFALGIGSLGGFGLLVVEVTYFRCHRKPKPRLPDEARSRDSTTAKRQKEIEKNKLLIDNHLPRLLKTRCKTFKDPLSLWEHQNFRDFKID